MSGLEIAAVAGVGLEAYSQISGANADSNAARRNAFLKNQQADELLSREEINEEIMKEQANLALLDAGASFAASGVEGGGIGTKLMIHRNLESNLLNARRDADFKARMLRAGAEADAQLASDIMTAGYIRTGASTIGGAAKVGSSYLKYDKRSKPEGLPQE